MTSGSGTSCGEGACSRWAAERPWTHARGVSGKPGPAAYDCCAAEREQAPSAQEPCLFLADRHGCRLLLPGPTQRRVQIHLGDQLRQPISDQPLLRTIQRALCVEKHQVAVDADAITVFGQGVVVLAGLDKGAMGGELSV